MVGDEWVPFPLELLLSRVPDNLVGDEIGLGTPKVPGEGDGCGT